MRNTRNVSWIKAARRDFEDFPEDVQSDMLDALTVAAALRYRSDAFRAPYAVRIDADIWVIHAFQKKSKSGSKTPQREVDLIHDRLQRLKEALK